MKNDYTPFKNELIDLTETDINSLIENEIGEGWFIEYKRSIPKTDSGKIDKIKIAKSISSFANTKGGWVFWGISCDNKNNPTILNGIDIDSFRNFEDQISQIINSNINPVPYYHFKKVELSNKNAVFIIRVEQSPTPPYISSQGIIYQRENNESKPINDRYIIEKLNEKTENYYKSIEKFCKLDLGETKGQSESNQSYLELYLFPNPYGCYKFNDFYSSNFFKDVAQRFYEPVNIHSDFNGVKSETPINISFNSIYSSERSLIIRPLKESNLIYKSTTVELFDNGNLKLLIPIYEFDTNQIPEHYKNSKTINYLLNKYSPLDDFHKEDDDSEIKIENIGSLNNGSNSNRLETDFVNHIKFIDGIEIIFTILIIISKYKSVLEKNKFDFSTEIGFRAKITDCWRKFVFFDDDDYLEKIKIYNIPLSPKNQIEIPEFKKGQGYKINLSEDFSYFTIAKYILEGIGLPDSSSINFNDIIKKGLTRFKT